MLLRHHRLGLAPCLLRFLLGFRSWKKEKRLFLSSVAAVIIAARISWGHSSLSHSVVLVCSSIIKPLGKSMADSFPTSHYPRSAGEGRGKRRPSRHQPHGGNPRASFAGSTQYMPAVSPRHRDNSPMPDDSPPYNASGRGSNWSSNPSSYHTQQRYLFQRFLLQSAFLYSFSSVFLVSISNTRLTKCF